MTDTSSGNLRREVLEEIVNRKKMGDKKFHSETSLQHYEDEDQPDYDDVEGDKDPGVSNFLFFGR